MNNTVNTHHLNGAAERSQRYHQPRSVEELTQRNIETILALEQSAQDQRTTTDKVVDSITQFCGNMAFVWVHAIWFGAWIILNSMPHMRHFDTNYALLTLIVSLEAIFLSTFILISQNRQTEISERRNHLDLQINLLTEQENTKMLSILMSIANKMEVKIEDDPDVKVLEQATRPDQLIEQIERATQKSSSQQTG